MFDQKHKETYIQYVHYKVRLYKRLHITSARNLLESKLSYELKCMVLRFLSTSERKELKKIIGLPYCPHINMCFLRVKAQ